MSIIHEPLSTKVFSELIDTTEPYRVDETFTKDTYVVVQPSSQNNLNVGGPIVFQTMHQDSYFLPAESYITIQGRLVKDDNGAYNNEEVTLVNNAMMYLFSEANYEISDTLIESVLNLGQTTSLFGYLTLPDDFSTSSGLNRCWSKDTNDTANSTKLTVTSPAIAAVAPGAAVPAIPANTFNVVENAHFNQGFAARKSFIFDSNPRGTFEFTIPFSHIFGFSEYKKLLYGVQQKLTLIRINDDLAIHHANGAPAGKVVLSNITWYIPKYQLSVETASEMLARSVAKIPLPINFRGRSSRTVSIPTGTTNFNWPLSVSSGSEAPRWLILGFQTDRLSQEKTPAVFDNIGITHAYVTLNDIRYPGTDIFVDFNRNQYSRLYTMLEKFKMDSYRYDELVGGTQVNVPAFKSLFPILVFDLTKQSEVIKTGVIDMRVAVMCTATPANTSAYALIISDRLFKLVSDGKTISQMLK